jgi:hypothetical protein
VQETDGNVINLIVSYTEGNFFSAFLIFSNINFIHTIFEISVPVSQKRSASVLHGPCVMETIANYCEDLVEHIHTRVVPEVPDLTYRWRL